MPLTVAIVSPCAFCETSSNEPIVMSNKGFAVPNVKSWSNTVWYNELVIGCKFMPPLTNTSYDFLVVLLILAISD